MANAEPDRKKKQHRSPAYPSMGLRAALDHAETIYGHERRSAAPVSVVASHCGTDIKSSKGLRLIAALKQFGLVIEEGSGEDRQVRLSETALDYLLAESEEQKAESVKTAALLPTIHRKIWENYRGLLPSDATLQVYLIRQLDFNDTYAARFIKQFRATLRFAGLLDDDTMEGDQSDSNEDDEMEATLDPQKQKPVNRTAKPALPLPPPPAGTPYLIFPLANGNTLEVRLGSKVSREDFQRIKTIIELAEPSFVEDDESDE